MAFVAEDRERGPAGPLAPAPAGRATAVYILALLMLVNTMNSIDRVIVNILIEPIRREFGFTDTQIGMIGGLGFALFYGLLGLPIARLADRYSRKRLLAAGLILWSAMTMVTGRAVGFWSMLSARFGVGIGEATCYPTSLSLISDYFAPRDRPRAVSLFQIGLDLGFIVGAPVAGIVAAQHGWRAAFYLLGLPGLVLAVLLLLTLREPVRGTKDSRIVGAAPRDGGAWAAMRALIAEDRVFPLLAAASMFMALGAATLALWGAAYMMRSHGLTEDQVGKLLGPILGGGGFVGTIIGGVVGTALARRDDRPFVPLKVMLYTAIPAIPGMILFVLAPTTTTAILGGLAGGILTSMHFGPLIATTISRVAPGNRGLAASLLVIGQSVIGFGFGPLIVGAISDALSPQLGTESLRYAMLFAPCCVLLAWTCVFVAWRMLTASPLTTAPAERV